MPVTGIYLSVTTGSQTWAGTDDALYLGLAGTVGGREFFLDTNGLSANTTKTFKWGHASFNADVEGLRWRYRHLPAESDTRVFAQTWPGLSTCGQRMADGVRIRVHRVR